MQIKRVMKAIGIIFGCIVLLIVGSVVFTFVKVNQARSRAESFCDKVQINEDIDSLEGIAVTEPPDVMHLLSSDGTPIGAFKDYKKLKLGIIDKSAKNVGMIFKSGSPGFSSCEINFSNFKILSKKVVKHN